LLILFQLPQPTLISGIREILMRRAQISLKSLALFAGVFQSATSALKRISNVTPHCYLNLSFGLGLRYAIGGCRLMDKLITAQFDPRNAGKKGVRDSSRGVRFCVRY
jgi:hypothetical protein